MSPPARRLLVRLAPLGWFVGALAVVVISVVAMREGSETRMASREPTVMRAATATLEPHGQATPPRD